MEKQPRSLPEDYNDNEEWQQLLEDIDTVDIPVELLKTLRAYLKDGTTFLFPIKEWIDQGSSIDEIDDAINRWYKVKDKDVVGTDFVVDLEKLKSTVTTQTSKIFKNIK